MAWVAFRTHHSGACHCAHLSAALHARWEQLRALQCATCRQDSQGWECRGRRDGDGRAHEQSLGNTDLWLAHQPAVHCRGTCAWFGGGVVSMQRPFSGSRALPPPPPLQQAVVLTGPPIRKKKPSPLSFAPLPLSPSPNLPSYCPATSPCPRAHRLCNSTNSNMCHP
jgi:hypothetical protein